MSESKDYSGADTAEVIHKLLSKFAAEGNTNCTIKTFSSLQSSGPNDLESRKSEIRCGHRKIEIMLGWKSGDRWIDLEEVLTAEQP